MNPSSFRSPRFLVLALIPAAGIALVAFALGRSGSPGAGEPGTAGSPALDPGPPPPGPFPPGETVDEASGAIDRWIDRGGRHLDEKEFELAAEAFENGERESRAAKDGRRLLRSALGRAEALANLGREAEGLVLASSLRRERPAAEPPPVEALRLAALESALLLAAGRPLEAAPVAREALDDADRHHAGDPQLRGLLVSALADALTGSEGFAEAARRIDEHLARPEVAGSLSPDERADWLDRSGRLHGAAGDFQVSVDRLESSLDARVAAGGENPVPAALTRISLAASLFDSGQPVRARAEAVKSHAVLSGELPFDHPEIRRLSDIASRIGADLPADESLPPR
jgi:tetratricopeptide (TPR) repeat protein